MGGSLNVDASAEGHRKTLLIEIAGSFERIDTPPVKPDQHEV